MRASTIIFGIAFMVVGTPAQTDIRLAWVGSTANLPGSSVLSGFLSAVKYLNDDPLTHLGNASFRVVPSFELDSVRDTDVHKIEVIRAVSFLASNSVCDHSLEVNSTDTPMDVHAIVLAGQNQFSVSAAPITEVFGKPVVGLVAHTDDLSDKALFPTFSRMLAPDRLQAEALAAVALSLGISRVGILVSSDFAEMREAFAIACESIGITVVAAVTFPTNLDLSAVRDRTALDVVAREVQESFTQTNVKVYMLAALGFDLFTGLTVLNETGHIGPEYTMLLNYFAIFVPPSPDPVKRELQLMMHGALGTFPFFDPASASADEMWAVWPKNSTAWTAMLDQAPVRLDTGRPPEPTANRAGISPFAHYSWDATILAAKGIATSYGPCGGDTHATGWLEINCTLENLRSTTFNGSTGPVILDSAGDRGASFLIKNVVNGRAVNIGSYTSVTAGGTGAALNISAIIWSDGVTGRSSAPPFGQAPRVITTPTPVAQTSEPILDTTLSVAVAIIVVLVVGILAGVIVVWRRRDQERKRMAAPANFFDVIQKLTADGGACNTMNFHAKARPSPRKIRKRTISQNTPISDSDTDVDESTNNNVHESEGYNIPNEVDRRRVTVSTHILGKGQFGTVYTGQHTATYGRVTAQIPVAIKMLRDEETNSTAQVEFLQEAAISWQFKHENVVGMYGVVTTGFPHLLLLELCENGCLLNVLKAQDNPDGVAISTSELIHFLYGIACGMAHLTSKHFVHRDVAARNVLLDSKMRPKICDFGLGRCIEGEDYYRVSNDTALPIRWSDPYAVENRVYSEGTDVWSFGITAVEVFSRGARPYGTWTNCVVIERVKLGYRLPNPKEMPLDVYTRIVKPCWIMSDHELAATTDCNTDTSFDLPEITRRIRFRGLSAQLKTVKDWVPMPTNDSGPAPESPRPEPFRAEPTLAPYAKVHFKGMGRDVDKWAVTPAPCTGVSVNDTPSLTPAYSLPPTLDQGPAVAGSSQIPVAQSAMPDDTLPQPYATREVTLGDTPSMDAKLAAPHANPAIVADDYDDGHNQWPAVVGSSQMYVAQSAMPDDTILQPYATREATLGDTTSVEAKLAAPRADPAIVADDDDDGHSQMYSSQVLIPLVLHPATVASHRD